MSPLRLLFGLLVGLVAVGLAVRVTAWLITPALPRLAAVLALVVVVQLLLTDRHSRR